MSEAEVEFHAFQVFIMTFIFKIGNPIDALRL